MHVVIGTGSGIGREVGYRLVREEAHIVCVDLNKDAAEATANEIVEKYGQGIGVAGSGGIGSLAKYAIPHAEDETTESLVEKLARFYADRTLTKSPITPADQAEAYFLLVSRRLSKTTGQVITVDGGLHEAFLR